MNPYITHLEWTDFYRELQKFGLLHIDQDKATSIANRVGDGHTIIFKLVGDEIPQWISDGFPMKPLAIQLFAINPKSIGMVHKDGLERRCAFNIPLLNCEQGHMDWFEYNYDQKTIATTYTQIRLTHLEKHFTEDRIKDVPSHRCYVNVPSIVNTDVWHRVDNSEQDKFRFMLSFRFVGNLKYADTVRKFDEFYTQ